MYKLKIRDFYFLVKKKKKRDFQESLTMALEPSNIIKSQQTIPKMINVHNNHGNGNLKVFKNNNLFSLPLCFLIIFMQLVY